ncbi:MAG: hypothetical protein GF329_11975 [Candidatus Lokiarchaeota archaeon]|nr:hypothetical protein [Candidatus Lokiarchaeota archaeon]
MNDLILCLDAIRKGMTQEKYLSYRFPKNVEEFIQLCSKLNSSKGLSMVQIHPFIIDSFYQKENYSDYKNNFKDLLQGLKRECPDLFFNINYIEFNSYEYDFRDIDLFPFRENSVVSIYINSYYEGGKRNNINHNEVIEWIDQWKEEELIIVPIICTTDDVEFLNNLVEKGNISNNSLVLFEFSGGGNLNPTTENYNNIRNLLIDTLNVMVSCEGEDWIELARSAIVNGDSVKFGLFDSLSVNSNMAFYSKITSIASAFGRSIANDLEYYKALK